MKIYEKAPGVQTRWSSFENPQAERGQGALDNKGCKGHPCDELLAGETKTLLDVNGSGTVHRIWMTIDDRSPKMLRSLRLDMYWDGASKPAASVPLGDFFGISLGRRTPFENALFSDPEGRSFNSFTQMPFRTAARISITNESDEDLKFLFYDVNVSLGIEHTADMLYFHTYWHRESPNELGQELDILPTVPGNGRFLGCNVGIITDPIYDDAWWGEGEVKVWFGDDEHPTLCGTGTEDYIGTAWGQGAYSHRTQGCPIADPENRQWCFYRYHLDDPIYFDDGCRVAIQTIGGCFKKNAVTLQEKNVPLIPVTIGPHEGEPMVRLMDRNERRELSSIPEDGWCNFWRQDDWSATAYFYHESPTGILPAIPEAALRAAELTMIDDASARLDS